MNLFGNSQFQILDNSLPLNSQVGPQSLSVLPPFTVTGSNTGSAFIVFNVSGAPRIFPNQLWVPSGANMNAAISGKTLRVLWTTGSPLTPSSPVTQIASIAPLANFVPTVSQSGTGQVVVLSDLGSSCPAIAQGWAKDTTLQSWPSEDPEDVEPGAVRVLGCYKAGNTNVQEISYRLPIALAAAVNGQPLTVSFRVKQTIKGGSGTSYAFANFNGTQVNGTPTAGAGGWEDVRVVIPAGAYTGTPIILGLALAGAADDLYYVARPYAATTNDLPSNFYEPRFGEEWLSKMDIVPSSIDGATIQFPSNYNDPTGVYCTLWHDHFAETSGRVHWTTRGIYAALEGEVTAGSAIDMRSDMGNASGASIVYGQAVYGQNSSILNAGAEILPFDDGLGVNSVGPGFLYIYTPTKGLRATSVSLDVQKYILN